MHMGSWGWGELGLSILSCSSFLRGVGASRDEEGFCEISTVRPWTGICILWPSSDSPLSPQIPLVPLTPALSILLNICLMLKLSYLTWLRFIFWLLVGKWGLGLDPSL